LAFAFWIGGEFISNQVLSRPYGIVAELKAEQSTKIELFFTVEVIQVLIDKNKGLTQVEVKTNDSELKKLEFEFPITEFEQVERKIAKELGLSKENVKKLARYQVKN
jgi:HD-GYP domain-containing protein (c-di-GMP phosphodiesterase class II)